MSWYSKQTPERKKEILARAAARNRERYRTDPEYRAKVKARNSAEKHKAHARAWALRYREENRDKANERKREWYRENRDHVAKYDLHKRLSNPVLNLLMSARWRCRRKGIAFTLTREWVAQNYTGRCAVTGIPFHIPTDAAEVKYGRQSAFVPSLDRLDPGGGYTPDNCRIVLWAFNRFKGRETDEQILTIAKAFVERHST